MDIEEPQQDGFKPINNHEEIKGFLDEVTYQISFIIVIIFRNSFKERRDLTR